MGRQIIAKIEFVFDEDQINETFREDGQDRFTDEELLDYVVDTVVDDIYDRVKYSTVSEAIHVSMELSNYEAKEVTNG